MEIDFDKVPATASAETVADFRAWYRATGNGDFPVSDDIIAARIPFRIADTLPLPRVTYTRADWPGDAAAAIADKLCDDFYKATEAQYDDGKTYSPGLFTVRYLARRLELTTPMPAVATPAAQLAPAADTKSADYLIGYNDARAASIAAIMRMTP